MRMLIFCAGIICLVAAFRFQDSKNESCKVIRCGDWEGLFMNNKCYCWKEFK